MLPIFIWIKLQWFTTFKRLWIFVHQSLITFFLLYSIKNQQCNSRSIGSNANLPTWLKHIGFHISWTLLFPHCGLLRRKISSICYTSHLYFYCILLCSYNLTYSLSFLILSKVSFPLSLQLALPPYLCWLLSRLLQGWDRTWDIWLPMVFSADSYASADFPSNFHTNFVHDVFRVRYSYCACLCYTSNQPTTI